MTAPRWRAPVVAAAVLAAALGVVAAVAVPWSVLGPGAPPVRATPHADFLPVELARDSAFHAALRVWTYPRLALDVAVPLVLGLTPWGGRLLVRVARPLGGSWPVQVVAGTFVLTAVPLVLGLPLSMGAELVLRRYGLSTQHWPGWTVDVVRGWTVGAAVTSGLLLVLVGLARRTPRGWWVPAAVLAAGFGVTGAGPGSRRRWPGKITSEAARWFRAVTVVSGTRAASAMPDRVSPRRTT
jgi:STE24 endopeptidase